jgi:hypothetical protein
MINRKLLKGILALSFLIFNLFAENSSFQVSAKTEGANKRDEQYDVHHKEDDHIRLRSSEEELEFNEDNPIFKITGHFKDLFTYTQTDQYSEYLSSIDRDKKKRLIADLKRVRISPEITISDWLHIHIDYDNEIITGSYLKSLEFEQYWRPPEYNDLFDLSCEPLYDEDIYYRTKIHRAFIKLIIGDLTATMGRQQIRFGSGRLWNPLDILNPISPTSIEDAEEQKGTDALRLEYYLTDRTEIALVLDQKRINNDDDPEKLNSENSNIIGRLKTTVVKTDIALLGGRVSRRGIGGVDISSILLDGILRGALLYSNPEEGRSFTQGSAGYEYNFSFGLYCLIEYFYNENGLNFNEELRGAYLNSLIFGINEDNYYKLSNQFLTFNQHYCGLALGYDITSLLRVEIFSIYDIQGRGIFYNPSLKYNALENLDLSAGYMQSHIFQNAEYDSDFGYMEKYGFLYASLTWYF